MKPIQETVLHEGADTVKNSRHKHLGRHSIEATFNRSPPQDFPALLWTQCTTVDFTSLSDPNWCPFSTFLRGLNTQQWHGDRSRLYGGRSNNFQCMEHSSPTIWWWVVLYKMTPLVRKPTYILMMAVQISQRAAIMQLFNLQLVVNCNVVTQPVVFCSSAAWGFHLNIFLCNALLAVAVTLASVHIVLSCR